ncbi:MAG: FAD-dependent oxidoreductase [Bdellovibrionales bacterium]
MENIVLLGAGHANLEVIKHLSPSARTKCRIVLVSESDRIFYSGLLPRHIMGEVKIDELTIDLTTFCKAKGVDLIISSAKSISPTKKAIDLQNGNSIVFDYLIINTGGETTRLQTNAPFRTIYVKPLPTFIEQWREVQRICSSCQRLDFVIVGGGAASVELAIAIKLRLLNNNSIGSSVHIITRGDRLCENYTSAISTELERATAALGIVIHYEENLTAIPESEIVLTDGKRLSYDYVFVSLPITPHEWNSKQSIDVDSNGYFLVDDYLRCSSNIYAAGDCSKMKSYPNLAKSGVIAVRQGQYLAKHLDSVLNKNKILPFLPSKKQLNILVSGSAQALLIFGSVYFKSSLSLKIKNWIDQRYMNSFLD